MPKENFIPPSRVEIVWVAGILTRVREGQECSEPDLKRATDVVRRKYIQVFLDKGLDYPPTADTLDFTPRYHGVRKSPATR
jgi:hypothetical protein